MLLSQFGKLESVEKIARVLSVHGMRCAGPVYARVCTMCACLKLDRAEVTSQRTCLHMSVNAVFFLRYIHPVCLQCDIQEIYGYFSRMRINTRAVCTRPPFSSEAWERGYGRPGGSGPQSPTSHRLLQGQN